MIELKIIYDASTRQVQVSGPINDKMLSYSMLEMARDAIKDHNDALRKNTPDILPASSLIDLNGRG